MYHRVGAAAFKKDLTNTLALCEHLGNPHQKIRTIHVAGTNGKGSVSHFLSAICQSAGLKVGLYTSPHYKDFRERIRINGAYIPKRKVVDFVDRNKAAIEQISPSFFEMCVAMAFDHFAKEKVDIAIIEVGLGGRLDSTNVIQPLLSVITNISFDHVDMLGDTLPLIAGEKAGIIKPGIPVVIGETHPETAPVFLEKAVQTGSSITFADQHYQVLTHEGQSGYAVVKNGKKWLDTLETEVSGPYQLKNIATALQAVEILETVPEFCKLLEAKGLSSLAPECILNGFGHLRALTRMQGRWQVIGTQPTILCDSAHNEAGIQLAFGQVAQMPHQRLHIVTGFVNDKDLQKALSRFPTTARYYFAKANIPRGLDAGVLKSEAAQYGLHGRAYSSVKNALKGAKRNAGAEDLILVIGSIFVVAEVI